MVQVAWIGLGNIGRGMVRNLVKNKSLDSPLIIYNRTTSKSEALQKELKESYPDKSVVVSTSIPDLVKKADIIFSILGNDASMEELAKTATESASGSLKGKLWIDCTSVGPETTDKLAEVFERAGAEFVASPVFGAPAAADAGQLIFVLASHSTSAIDRVIPYTTNVMGKSYLDFRNSPPSKAAIMKFSGNHLILNMATVLSESLVMSSKSGIGEETMAEFIKQMFGGTPYVAYSRRMLDGDYEREEPLFAVDLALKDVRHMKSVAEKAGTKLGTIDVSEKLLKQVKEEKGEKGDLAGMYGALRVNAGLPYSNREEKKN